MSDPLFTLSLLGGLIGLIAAVSWTAHRVFSWIGNRLPGRRPPGWAKGISLSRAPRRTFDPYSASYQMAMSEWGTKIINTGDEVSMCAFQLLFRIDPSVAGVFEVTTIEGEALFTPGRQCMAIIDKNQITVLDRVKQHGVHLASDHPGRLGFVVRRTTLQGTTLAILLLIDHEYFESTGTRRPARFSQETYSVDLHAEHASALIPAGWPGGAELLSRPE